MEKISINRNGLGIFKINSKKAAEKNPVKENGTASSNPFGIHFKGNVIQADVFETSNKNAEAKTGLREKLANTGKMFKSSIVGGINSFNDSLKSKANSIVSFGRKAKESITNALKFANEYDVGSKIKETFNSIQERIVAGNTYSVKNLTKRPVSELESMLKDELGK